MSYCYSRENGNLDYAIYGLDPRPPEADEDDKERKCAIF